MVTCSAFPYAFQTDGVLRVDAALASKGLARLWSQLAPETASGAVSTRSGSSAPGVYAARALLLSRPQLPSILAELGMDEVANRALGTAGFPIDALFFDKGADANWAVPAHQDIVVPVPPNSVGLSVRNSRMRHGTFYGEPPLQALRELVALRLHFDDCSRSTGGLAVIPGSHDRRWSDAQLAGIPSDAFRHCDCRAGDVLLMKPLVVHRSPRAEQPQRRRVLHVLYAPTDGWHARLSGYTGMAW
ncbi:MAG TPA: phytanoyl-CoA dioxygenase family protein [Polyangiaceae bacterium]|nr:phytanoyl-CoA dioxygenase family protein [Polyangiaceae bacterium]